MFKEDVLNNIAVGASLITSKLEENNQKLLYLAVSGSHAWGLQKPESDFDLRGIYQDSTERILDLVKPRDTIEFTDGLYDVQLYEVEKFFRMLCNHNGNMVTLLHLPICPFMDTENVPWSMFGEFFLTKKLRLYYRGYADSQRKRALSQRGGKALIYTYREMFSGLYLMKYGFMCFDFKELWREAEENGWYNEGLLYKYYSDPKLQVTDDGWTKFYNEWEELSEKLDAQAEKASLPEDFNGYELCNTHLRLLRLKGLNGGA